MGNTLRTKDVNGRSARMRERRERQSRIDQMANSQYSITAHLQNYKPESNANDVKSFLVLVELCDYSLALMKIIDAKGNSFQIPRGHHRLRHSPKFPFKVGNYSVKMH